MSAYGSLKHAGHAELAVVERLRAWMPYYVPEVERQDGREVGVIKPLRSIVTASELDRFPEDQGHTAVVVSPGTIESPSKNGSGDYSAEYNVSVVIIAGARDEKGSRALAHVYSAAVRGCLLQRRKLAEGIEVVDWLGEDFDVFAIDDRRTKAGLSNSFSVELAQVVTWKTGPAPTWPPDGGDPEPAEPPDDPTQPPPDPVEATDVHVQVEEKP